MNKTVNYIIIALSIFLFVGNLWENNFTIDKSNIWRLVSNLMFFALGVYNIRQIRK